MLLSSAVSGSWGWAGVGQSAGKDRQGRQWFCQPPPQRISHGRAGLCLMKEEGQMEEKRGDDAPWKQMVSDGAIVPPTPLLALNYCFNFGLF